MVRGIRVESRISKDRKEMMESMNTGYVVRPGFEG
jgi:hypothetical protein